MKTLVILILCLTTIQATATDVDLAAEWKDIPANGYWYAQTDVAETHSWCAKTTDTDGMPVQICGVLLKSYPDSDTDGDFFRVIRACDPWTAYVRQKAQFDQMVVWGTSCDGSSRTVKTFRELIAGTKGLPGRLQRLLK